MKKLISAALSATLALSMLPCSFAASFKDIDEDRYSWAKPYIEDMADLGFISGYEDGTYRPDNEVTRLEAISLFARAMGSSNEDNTEVVNYALEKYTSVIDKYSLNFGKKEIAYMLYRGALKTSELDTYLKGDLKNKPMPRYEAAIIITKAMGAEEKAKQEIMIDLSYKDAKNIPSKASQYVYYVTEQNIMSGMEDGTFSPDTSVLRSQIAVMLSKTVDAFNVGFEKAKVVSINTKDQNIQLKDSVGDTYYMGYNNDTKFYLEGQTVADTEVVTGMSGVFTYANGNLLYVDIISTTVDETVKGVFQEYSSITDGESVILTLFVIPTGSTKAVQYKCASGVSVIRSGAKSTIREFLKGDYVTLDMSKDLVQQITAETKTTTISNATVSDVSIDDNLTLTISHTDAEYDGTKYIISNDVVVRKNSETSSMANIYKGDIVTLTLDYGVVTMIVAKSNTKSLEGKIQSVTIAATPKITVVINDTPTTYDVPTGVKITDASSQTIQLYDLRVNQTVRVTIESQAVTAIQVTGSTPSDPNKNFSGTIVAINTSYGFIKVQSAADTTEEIIYCKDSSTTFVPASGKSNLYMKDLKVGDVVSARGSEKNGAFEATLVIVESK